MQLNSKRLSFLSAEQIEYVIADMLVSPTEELQEEHVISFFETIKKESRERFLDVVKLLEDTKMKYLGCEIASMTAYIMYCRKKLKANGVNVELISPQDKAGRINLFKILGNRLARKNKEEFMQWMKQTKNENDKYQIKNPDYRTCKTKYLSLLKEDFKVLEDKLKIGSFINYDYKRDKFKRNDVKKYEFQNKRKFDHKENDSYQDRNYQKKPYKVALVKRSKRGTVLECWNCKKNHSMKECPSIPTHERIQKWQEEYKRRQEKWKANKASNNRKEN